MVPDKFNMVDMGGVDLIMMQGEAVPGLYDKLMAAISNCRYQCLYNWLFDGVLIPPTYVQIEVDEGEVYLNEGVSVTSDNVIHIYSIEPPAPEPEIIPLLAEENGVYNVPAGKDGFNPVTVNVPSYTPVISPLNVTQNGTYTAPSGVDGYSPIVVDVSGGTGTQVIIGYADPDASVGANGNIYVQAVNDGVEYIQSDGNQYIDLGVPGNTIYGIDFEYMPISGISTYQGYLSDNTDDFTLGRIDNVKTYFRIRGSEKARIDTPFNQKVKMSVKDNGIYKNDVYQASAGTTNSLGAQNGNLCLFSKYNGSDKSAIRFYRLKLYDLNGDLFHDFIPAKNNDAYCVYDKITGNYFNNLGSGSFSGMDIEDGTIIGAYVKANNLWTPLIGANVDDIET